MSGIRVSEKLNIPEEQLQWSYARSSGPGGQNVNKVNSKATLRWTPVPGTVPAGVMARFRQNAKRYLTLDGEIVIQSQEHREQAQNIDACRRKLCVLLRESLHPPKRRIPTKPSRGATRRRLDNKRKLSDKKKDRREKF